MNKSIIYRTLIFLLMVSAGSAVKAQDTPEDKAEEDSLLISSYEDIQGEPPKVLHAEPLYIDLIRDLGARKGEREWNFGAGLTDFTTQDQYEFLVEYEFAAANRFGVEFEIPVLIFSGKDTASSDPSKIESLKAAVQWTFLVDQRRDISLALGYINEVVFYSFEEIASDGLFEGNLFNPFFVGAKRFGNNFHTLIYTGPRIEYFFDTNKTKAEGECHLNFHYMVKGTGNFIGVEYNQYFGSGFYSGVLRPQMRVDINENLLVGILTGIPLTQGDERLSFFVRLIYEPEFRLH